MSNATRGRVTIKQENTTIQTVRVFRSHLLLHGADIVVAHFPELHGRFSHSHLRGDAMNIISALHKGNKISKRALFCNFMHRRRIPDHYRLQGSHKGLILGACNVMSVNPRCYCSGVKRYV